MGAENKSAIWSLYPNLELFVEWVNEQDYGACWWNVAVYIVVVYIFILRGLWVGKLRNNCVLGKESRNMEGFFFSLQASINLTCILRIISLRAPLMRHKTVSSKLTRSPLHRELGALSLACCRRAKGFYLKPWGQKRLLFPMLLPGASLHRLSLTQVEFMAKFNFRHFLK